MKFKDLLGKRVLILGFGVEGKATYQFLKKNYPDIQLGVADKTLQGESYLEEQEKYDIVIKSPGVKGSLVKIPFTTATNLFFANRKGKVIAVTGTKGKSTTSALIYAMLKQEVKKIKLLGNITHKMQNIGDPLLTGLDLENDKETHYVCELSSQQLADLKFSPDIAVITNFFPEHLDFHGNLENYWQAKTNIANFLDKDHFFVYNPDFPSLVKLAGNVKARPVPYVEILSYSNQIIPLKGKHNFDNIKAAVTVAKILGLRDKNIWKALEEFKPLPHRMEEIGKYKGLNFINDAISTTPQSTIQAIETFKNIGTILLGGKDRDYEFENLAETIIKYNIHNFVFFPDTGEKILKTIKRKIKDSNYIINYIKTDKMEDAVKFAFNNSPEGSYVLLSTASPSYSVWTNFEEKGKMFSEAVKNFGR